MEAFILNDENVENSHGFYLLNNGGKFDRFNSNPVMFYNHKDETLPIGKWERLRMEGNLLMADPVFDDADDEAARIKGKVERGFLKGASLGITPLKAEYRDGKLFVTEWETIEASIVNIPSNKKSLRLYNKEGKLMTSLDEIKLNLNNIITNQIEETIMDKPTISVDALTKLSLDKAASETAIENAIVALHNRADKAENELKSIRLKAAETLVDDAITKGRLTADKKDAFVQMAIDNFDNAKSIIEALPAKENLSSRVKPPKGGEDRSGWTYLDWAKKDSKGLELMRQQDPEAFEELLQAYRENRK